METTIPSFPLQAAGFSNGVTYNKENDMNIYVGNLSYDATEETIKQAFESFGEVTSARVIKTSILASPEGLVL